MKIKKSLLSLLLFAILLIPSAYSQNLQIQTINQPGCGTPPMTEQQRKYTLNFVDKVAVKREVGTTFVPIRIHRVTLDDGTGGVAMGDVNKGIANLNNFYLTAGIQFYIASVNTIVSSDWYDFSQDEESLMTTENSIYDAPNVYFVDAITVNGGGGACGYARYPGNYKESLNILMDNGCLLTPNGTFVHEFGHFFNLAHTHNSTEFGNDNANAENVPRAGENSNCGTTGDLLCDTQADPNGSNDAACNFVNDGESTADANGLAYTPDIDNVMSYYSDSCGGIFTPEQYTRITNALATRLSHTNYTLDAAPEDVSNASGLTATTNASYGIDLAWTDNASNELGYLVERSSDGGTTWVSIIAGGVDQNLNAFTDATISSNTAYKYRVKASNDSGNEYSNEVSIDTGLIYCTPTHQGNSCDPNNSGLGIAIYNLILDGDDNGDISNLDNGCTGPLSIFSSDHSANVTAGNNYTVAGDFIKDGSVYSQYLTIWIDLNQDGDFEDANETIYQADTAGQNFSAPITIPATAINGTTTMRLRSAYESMGQVTSACGFIALSETEDYELIVSGGATTAPTVTNVTSTTTDGSYTTGAVIPITVTFSEVVNVTGTPQITLETGDTDAVVNYSTGTGTNTLTFNYTVGTDHTSADLDYVGTSSLALNSGTIQDAASNDATLTLANPGTANSLGANKALIIDTTAPTVTNVTSTTTDGSYTTGAVIPITVTFSEAVSVTGTPQITLETGGTDAVVDYSSGTGSNTLIFTYTIQAGHTTTDLDYETANSLALNSGTIQDAASNDATLTLANPGTANSLGANKALIIDTSDTTPPIFENNTPNFSSISQTEFNLATDINEAGTIYYVVVSDGSAAPSSAEVKAGTGQVASGNAIVTSGDFSNNFNVSGVTANTAYDVYIVAEDDETTPNIQTNPTKIDLTTAVLSLDDNSLIDLVKIYPNPVMSELYIKTNSIQLEQLVVYDVLGKVIINTKLNLDKIDVSTLALGMYILKIKTNKGTVVHRIIKK